MLLAVMTKADGYLQFMTVLILFVFVLVITYLVTRWIAKYQKDNVGFRNLEIIETCRIASNKYIQIVRAGSRYLVIAVGKDEVHMLSEISGEELSFQENTGQTMEFAAVLEKIRKLKEKDKE